MGLFSGILGAVGSVFGPVGTAIGGAIGGAVDGKNKQKADAKAVAAQNQANQQAVQASVETTDRWRHEDRYWSGEDTASERQYAEKLINDQNAYNDPAAVRARAEAAGFNPLALLGSGVGIQAGTAPYGGGSGAVGTTIAPIADIAASPIASSDLSLLGEAFGSGMQEYSSAVSEATQLRQHNNALKQELARAVIRPSVGGIYGGGDVPVQMIAANKYGSKGGDEVAELIGPRNAVNLYNPTAKKWIKVHPGIAARLELKDGDTIIAEDYEAILGDVGSELINTPNAVNEAFGFGNALPYDGVQLNAKYGGPMSMRPAKTNKSTRDKILQHKKKREARGF